MKTEYPDSTRGLTRVRYKVVGMAVLLAMVTYLDRVCISKIAPNIMAEMSLSKVQMGYVFSAFALSYAMFEIPTARWADLMGARRVLTRIVVWWSGFTIATAAAFSYASLLIIRFLFGAGEAGAWPSVARTFSRWIPLRERGRIQGIFFAGAHLSGGLTPMLVTWLLTWMHWRMIFACFGMVGFVWALAWYRWFRDDPAEHPEVGPAEMEYIAAGRLLDTGHRVDSSYWKRLFGNRNMIALCVMYFPNSFVFYFCITWLPTYLKEQHGFEATALGFFAGLPLLLSVVGDLLGGVVTDAMTARFGLRLGRCGVGGVAYLIAGLSLLAAAGCGRPLLAASLIALATAASMFTLAASWGTAIEVGANHAGAVSATMNTSGAIGSLLCPLIVAYALKWFGSWNISLYLMGALFLVGVVCWGVIDPRKRIFENAQKPA